MVMMGTLQETELHPAAILPSPPKQHTIWLNGASKFDE
jgi:hypothetical protein